jgi:hypothetical protein
LAGWIRDEIRQIGPNMYLSIIYEGKSAWSTALEF